MIGIIAKKKHIKPLISLLTAFFLIFSSVTAYAEDFSSELDKLNQEKEAASQGVQSARNRVEKLKEEQAAAIDEKMALEELMNAASEQIELVDRELEIVNGEIARICDEIEVKEREVEEARTREERQLEKYRERVRSMEENGHSSVWSLVLGCRSYTQLLSVLVDYNDIMTYDTELYEQLQETRMEREELERALIEYKGEQEVIRDGYEADRVRLEEEKAGLEQDIAESEALIEEYSEKIREAEEEQAAMERAEAAAANAVQSYLADFYRRQAEAEAARKAAAEAAAQAAAQQSSQEGGSSSGGSEEGITGAYTPVVQGQTDGGGQSGGNEQGSGSQGQSGSGGSSAVTGTGSYTWPFPGHTSITSYFGYRNSTGTYHSGVDIDGYASAGSPIVAADSGTVIMASYYGGYGNCIIIDHGNGISTLYAHLNSMNVGVGSAVSRGQTIGGVGNTGTCYGLDGVHLHFEVRINGSAVDPLGYI